MIFYLKLAALNSRHVFSFWVFITLENQHFLHFRRRRSVFRSMCPWANQRSLWQSNEFRDELWLTVFVHPQLWRSPAEQLTVVRNLECWPLKPHSSLEHLKIKLVLLKQNVAVGRGLFIYFYKQYILFTGKIKTNLLNM